MEIIGKVTHLLPLVTGQGRNGEWRKQEFVIEIAEGQFPKRICFSLWGDKISQFPVVVDDTVKVSFDIDSKEYNGRWFTEVRAWRVEKQSANSPVQTASPQMPSEPPAPFNAAPVEDDLPF